MAKLSKEELIALFETGDKPSQQDFYNLIDSLIGQKNYQPINSPVYMAQNQEVSITHPEIVNEQYQIQISQEFAGVSGQTNISIDFAQAAEASNYIQDDAIYGTDFIDGMAKLHYTSGTSVALVGNQTSNITMSESGTWHRNAPLTNFINGDPVSMGVNPLNPAMNNTIVFDFNGVSKILNQINIGTGWLAGWRVFGIWCVEASNSVSGPWTEISASKNWDGTPWVCDSLIPYTVFRLRHTAGTTPDDNVYLYGASLTVTPITYPLAAKRVTTNDVSHFVLARAAKIQSLSIAALMPNETLVKCRASFDGRNTWKKWDGSTWIESNDYNSITELQLGFNNFIITSELYIDLEFVLQTNNQYKTPAIDSVTIVYQDISHYNYAVIGTDFSVSRINPTTTIVKRLNSNAGKAFITIAI